jgi:ATP-binding cassette subfamily C exporter for protease/lipase
VVLITHRTSIIGMVDKILFLRDGALQAYGPRKEVLEALLRAQQQAQQQAQQAAQPAANPTAHTEAQVQSSAPAV